MGKEFPSSLPIISDLQEKKARSQQGQSLKEIDMQCCTREGCGGKDADLSNSGNE